MVHYLWLTFMNGLQFCASMMENLSIWPPFNILITNKAIQNKAQGKQKDNPNIFFCFPLSLILNCFVHDHSTRISKVGYCKACGSLCTSLWFGLVMCSSPLVINNLYGSLIWYCMSVLKFPTYVITILMGSHFSSTVSWVFLEWHQIVTCHTLFTKQPY